MRPLRVVIGSEDPVGVIGDLVSSWCSKRGGHQSADTLGGSDGGSSKGLNLLVCTIRSDVPIFMVTLVGPFSSVTVHGPVHRGSSFPQLGFDSSTCCPVHNCLPSEPPYALCCLSAASTTLASTNLLLLLKAVAISTGIWDNRLLQSRKVEGWRIVSKKYLIWWKFCRWVSSCSVKEQE